MKVTVIDSLSGRPRTMGRRFAKILTKLGRARYMTRDMKAQGDSLPSVPQGNSKPTTAKRARKTTSKPK